MSKKTRANFMAAEKLRKENAMLRRQIDWLISEIRYGSASPQKDWARCALCPSSTGGLACEHTSFDGIRDLPDCECCWREHARRCSE